MKTSKECPRDSLLNITNRTILRLKTKFTINGTNKPILLLRMATLAKLTRKSKNTSETFGENSKVKQLENPKPIKTKL